MTLIRTCRVARLCSIKFHIQRKRKKKRPINESPVANESISQYRAEKRNSHRICILTRRRHFKRHARSYLKAKQASTTQMSALLRHTRSSRLRMTSVASVCIITDTSRLDLGATANETRTSRRIFNRLCHLYTEVCPSAQVESPPKINITDR